MAAIGMALIVPAIVALLAGAIAVWRRGERRRAVLMVLAALVIAGNVAIWAIPFAPVAAASKPPAI